MRTSISPINFESNIKLISPNEFKQKICTLPKKLHEVGYPWTPDEIKIGKNIYTQDIMNCVAGGVIDNNVVRMFHQGNWTEEQAKIHSQKVFNPKELEEKLLSGLDSAKEKIHGFIFGGMGEWNENERIFIQKIQDIFHRNKISCTEITHRKDVHHYGRYSLLYENETDTWNITNALIGKKDVHGRENAMEINGQEVLYTTYSKTSNGYKSQKHTGSLEDYFRSQFLNVRLSEYDRFV